MKVVAPSNPADAKGLLRAAIRDPNPVLVLENEMLYGALGDVPTAPDWTVPIGKARVVRPGAHVETIITSVQKTNRIVTVEEAWPVCSVGAEICAQVAIQAFDYLDAPPAKVSGADVPMPYAANLELLALPSTEQVVDAARATLYL